MQSLAVALVPTPRGVGSKSRGKKRTGRLVVIVVSPCVRVCSYNHTHWLFGIADRGRRATAMRALIGVAALAAALVRTATAAAFDPQWHPEARTTRPIVGILTQPTAMGELIAASYVRCACMCARAKGNCAPA